MQIKMTSIFLPHSSQNGYHQETNVGEDVGKNESLCTVGGNVN
jgi:hypothetical protein